MTEKERRLAAWCRERGVDGVWLRRRTNIAWLTDGADVHVDGASTTGVASLVWTPRRKVVLTSNIEKPRLADEEFGEEWVIQPHDWWRDEKPPRGRLATDVPEDPFADLRASLTDLELARARDLGLYASIALEQILKGFLRPGHTELEIAGALSGLFRGWGASTPVLLVAADDRIAKYRHPIPTGRKIEKTVLVAVCPRRHGLMVAATRLVHFGKKLPPALRRKHDAVCKVDAAFHAATAPGQRWCDILLIGLQAYRETGFGEEWKQHHQGGPLGYEGRDYKATPKETRKVAANQLVGWNPSITGTKSEDTILSTGEVLTAARDWPMAGTRPDILCRG
ncbi:MAG TPA: M24 family metallopeptidase [Planctomycetota bacterium]|nr:M24 family metallopeptidase [Planctomycetota bacterium]